MKLAFVHGVDDVRFDEVETPVVGEDDVLIAVASAGICGSDLGFARAGGLSGPSDCPLAIGHELSGTVADVGRNVTSVKVGDRVVLNPLVNMIGNGAPEGGFAERLLVRDVAGKPQSLLLLPDRLSFDVGALVEPLSVALHTLNRGEAKAGEKVAIFGAGPIGLACLVMLKQRGIEDIVVFDLSPFRRQRALKLGAKSAFDPRELTPAEALTREHGSTLMWRVMPVVGTDLFIEASGAPHLIPEIIGYGKYNSRIAVVAIQKKPVAIDLQIMTGKEMSITTTMGYPQEFPEVLSILDNNDIDLEPMISHRFAGDDFLKAFDAANQADSSAKVLVQFSQ